ncbi:MAG: DUF5777 family beta-barrel protein, partial [Bacteroidales bacterium]|nr:DUF5777 family beta-barrel protein [Bacteroidales bacterium]
MKKIFLILTLALFITPLFAQDAAESGKTPVDFTFNTSMLIDNQTVAYPFKGSFQLEIQHRFSLIENVKNLFGIYGSANTRMALNYGVSDRIMVGFGTTKDYKLQDLQWKYAILRQTTDNSMPVSVSYFGNAVLDARSDDNFGPEESYEFIHRFSYFTQLIIARKFNDKISLQVAPSFAYFNSVP